MMSQNRQDTKDRLRGELDFDVNRRAESEIQGLASKLNELDDKIGDVVDLLRERRYPVLPIRISAPPSDRHATHGKPAKKPQQSPSHRAAPSPKNSKDPLPSDRTTSTRSGARQPMPGDARATPKTSSRSAPPITSQSIAPRSAPSAIRIPISAVSA